MSFSTNSIRFQEPSLPVLQHSEDIQQAHSCIPAREIVWVTRKPKTYCVYCCSLCTHEMSFSLRVIPFLVEPPRTQQRLPHVKNHSGLPPWRRCAFGTSPSGEFIYIRTISIRKNVGPDYADFSLRRIHFVAVFVVNTYHKIIRWALWLALSVLHATLYNCTHCMWIQFAYSAHYKCSEQLYNPMLLAQKVWRLMHSLACGEF